MQLHRHTLGVGELVPSRPALPFWASGSGMGDLVGSAPGLPFWPSGAGMGDLVTSAPGLPFWPSGSGMGDTVPTSAMYPLTPNSVLQYYQQGGLTYGGGLSGCGSCCESCAHGGPCEGSKGMGQAGPLFQTAASQSTNFWTDLQSIWTDVTSGNWSGATTAFFSTMSDPDPIFGIMPSWILFGAPLVLWLAFFSGGKHSRYQRARTAYSRARGAYA